VSDAILPDSCFVVLALLAEGEAHGYEVQRLAHLRGFRFWTKLQRSSIYNALALLEAEGLIEGSVQTGDGPDRKVFRITRRGRARVAAEAVRHLEDPSHPRNEIDLGVYALPFLPRSAAVQAMQTSLASLRARRTFLEERLAWCRERRLRVPAWAFERPLVALCSEIEWLERVVADVKERDVEGGEWAQYEYREPPPADAKKADDAQPRGRRKK
jgi:DNA-binding PadR family transcriptional regulator